MRLIDRDISKARALVVDANPTSRSVLVSQLRDLGVETIRQAGRVADARQHLERSAYDIVLCDYHFAGTDMTGQDLLDELRREHLLPWSTVFIMVTGEASYARVVEAAESALDSYLIKPYRPALLAERLMHARQRKRVLADILRAVDRSETDLAVQLCMARFTSRDVFWPFAARLAAELELQRHRPAAALLVFEAVLAVQAWPWARLGIARAQWAQGEASRAKRTAQALLKEEPGLADAHDVLGRIQIEQGDLEGALETFRLASALTPGCLLRLQQHGTLAFYKAPAAEAMEVLERGVSMGLRSKLFDALCLFLVALLRHDTSDAKGLLAVCNLLKQQSKRHPSSTRMQRMHVAVKALQTLGAGMPADALAFVREAGAKDSQDRLEAEWAHMAIALAARVPTSALAEVDAAALIAPLALRFCTSKGSTETIVAFAQHRPALVDVVRECHAKVSGMAEEALAHSVRGRPEEAVRQLLRQGEDSGNAKLIEMARLVLTRHRDAIADADALGEHAATLQSRFAGGAASFAGERRTKRSPGGLVLRQALPA